jgi:hypothetical protein
LSEPKYPDGTGFVQKIVTVTGPGPVLGFFDKASGDRVAVHVLQLFDPFVVNEDIEIGVVVGTVRCGPPAVARMPILCLGFVYPLPFHLLLSFHARYLQRQNDLLA